MVKWTYFKPIYLCRQLRRLSVLPELPEEVGEVGSVSLDSFLVGGDPPPARLKASSRHRPLHLASHASLSRSNSDQVSSIIINQ